MKIIRANKIEFLQVTAGKEYKLYETMEEVLKDEDELDPVAVSCSEDLFKIRVRNSDAIGIVFGDCGDVVQVYEDYTYDDFEILKEE